MDQIQENSQNDTENDETLSTSSSMSIIMADELDRDIDECKQLPSNNPSACGETVDLPGAKEEHYSYSENGSEDSFSEMTRSQYAQVGYPIIWFPSKN